MIDFDKAARGVVDQFFKEIPKLEPIRELVQDQIDVSPHLLFFGRVVVLVVKSISNLMRNGNQEMSDEARRLLTDILNFLEDSIQSISIDYTLPIDDATLVKDSRTLAPVYFAENLHNADAEYHIICSMMAPKLKAEIDRVETYEGIPKASTDELYNPVYRKIKEIIG